MKKLVMLAALALGANCAIAQKAVETEIPQVVKSAFAKAYPNVKGVKWEKEDGDFEASFDQGKEDYSVVYNASGELKEIETEIEHSELPVAAKNVLKKDYAEYKVQEAAKIVKGSVTTYEAELKKGKETFDFIFDASGKLLEKVAHAKKENKD